MPYKLQKDEPLAAGLKRIAEEQLTSAIRQLHSPPDLNLGIYEARKYLKKARSVLRLLEPQLGPIFVEENRRLRDVARRFSALRDTCVSLDLLEKFSARYKRKGTLNAQRQALRAKQIALRQGNWETTLTESVDALVATRKRVEDWPLLQLSVASLEAEFEKAHKHSHHALARAIRSRTAEDFHEFRKSVKLELNQARLLEASAANLHDLKQLATMLGDHHNLAVLMPNVENPSKRFQAMVRRQTKEFEAGILTLGSRIYQTSHKVGPSKNSP